MVKGKDLDPRFSPQQISITLLFRRDRVGDSHGGIVVYVKVNIPCKKET